MMAAQNALDPAGPQAYDIAVLTWVMTVGGTVILVLVTALVLIGTFRNPARRSRFAPRTFIIAGGVVLPVVVLSALLVYALVVGRSAMPPVSDDDLHVHVVGYQWWWEVRYVGLGADGGDLVSANEIRIPVGRPVEITLESADVIHSLWVPNLAGKIDMIPGRINRLALVAGRPGVFRAQCAEFCGLQHALMALHVVAATEPEFQDWLEREREAAAEPKIPLLRDGRAAFLASGCGACHTVRGTPAAGQSGPDLTHFGSRHGIAAATLPNTVGATAGWIAGAQHIKPGNAMPSFNALEGPTLRAIAHWLESLK